MFYQKHFLSVYCVPQYVEMGLPCFIAPPTTDVPAQHSDVGEHPIMVITII